MTHELSIPHGCDAAPDQQGAPDIMGASIRSAIDASPVAAIDVLCSALSGTAAGGDTLSPAPRPAEELWTARVLHANDMAWRLFGATSAEALTRHLQRELTRVEVQITLLACIRTSTLRHAFGVELCRLAGSTAHLDITANRVGGTGGLPARIVVYMEDRGHIEACLRNQEAYRRQLAHLVEQRNEERVLLRNLSGDRTRLLENLLLARNPYVVSHMRRVAVLSDRIGRCLGISESERADTACAAALHDVGILNVPNEILSRSGPLSELEFALVQQHPLHSCEILAAGGYPESVLRIIAAHHERCDGSGYPLGVSGDEICVGARILAVADVVDAMTTLRPHRPPLDTDSALQALGADAGRFDPRIIDACHAVLESDMTCEGDDVDFAGLHVHTLGIASTDRRLTGLQS